MNEKLPTIMENPLTVAAGTGVRKATSWMTVYMLGLGLVCDWPIQFLIGAMILSASAVQLVSWVCYTLHLYKAWADTVPFEQYSFPMITTHSTEEDKE